MGFFKRKPTMSELEDERDRLNIQEESMTKRAEIAEREAVIAQLKKQYGSSWMKTLGVSKFTDLSTLRSFLVSAKQGLEGQAKRDISPVQKTMYDFRVPRA